MINISGLSKAEILAALYNAASPNGFGFVQSAATPGDMTVLEAQQELKYSLHFDYLHGRVLKIDLVGDELNPRLYDRDNGGDGTAERIIERLRATGAVSSSESKDHKQAIVAQRAYEQPDYVELGDALGPLVAQSRNLWQEITNEGLPEYDPNRTPKQHLDWAADQALVYYDKGENSKCMMLFLQLLSWHPRTLRIAMHPLTGMMLWDGFTSGSRGRMEYMLKGFTV